MPRIVPKLLVPTLIILLFSGCATVSNMRTTDLNQGKSQTFQANVNDVVKAVEQIISKTKRLRLVSSEQVDPRSWVIIAEESMSLMSYGTLVRVSIAQMSINETTVNVLTKRRLATNITAKGDYSSEILGYIPAELQKGAALAGGHP